MINIEVLANDALKLKIEGKLDEADFQKIGANVDDLTKINGTINLLIDATAFEGWSNMKAAQTHFAFVRDHQKKISRIALVAGHEWQHWVAGIVSIFVHPEIKIFDADGIIQAESWLKNKKMAA